MTDVVNSSFSPDGNVSFENVYIYGTLHYDFEDQDLTFKSLNVTGKTILNDDIDLSGNLNVSNDAKITGIATFNNIEITGKLTDGDGGTGIAGQILSTDGTDLEWINASSANVGSASKVGVNDSSNSSDKMYITFVDATSGNEEIRVGTGITYAPSSDKLYVKNIASPAGNLELQAVSGENGIVIKDNHAVELYFNGSTLPKLETKSDGVEIRDNLYLADNDTLKFGNNNDLHISHTNALSGQNDSNGDSVLDGDNWCSYIKETGTGPLVFKSNGGPSTGAYHFYDTSWRPILKLFSGTNARTALYHAGSEKLITSNTGVTVTGTVAATAYTGDGSGLSGMSSGIPTGGIILWSGAANAIPSGWALCDGSNSTPDLKGKFVVGYHAGDSDYDVNDTGGTTSTTLSTSQLPAHSHDAGSLGADNDTHTHDTKLDANRVFGFTQSGDSTDGETSPYGNPGGIPGWNIPTNLNASDTHNHNISGNTGNRGGGGAIENRPPYYALCYIMKT